MATKKWSSEDWARLGAALRKAREERGWSRKKLAELSGVSEKSIQLTEEGRVPTRWPKSLTILAGTLGWEAGTVPRILDGNDPFAEFLDGAIRQLSADPDAGADTVVTGPDGVRRLFEVKNTVAAIKGINTWWLKQLERLDLPEELSKAVPQLTSFADRSLAYGAPELLVAAFTNCAYLMLEEIHKKRLDERLKRPVTTMEESERRVRDLELELKRVRDAKEALETLLSQSAESDEPRLAH